MSAIRVFAAIIGILVFTATSSPTWAQPAPVKNQRLSKRVKSVIVDQVVPAYRSEDALTMIKSLSPMLARMKEEQLNAVDALLEEYDVPATRELVVDSRLILLRLGQLRGVPSPRGIELPLLLRELEDRVSLVVAKAKAHPTMVAADLPELKDLEEYEELFWSVHVLGNELIAVRQIAAYGLDLTQSKGNKGGEGLPDFSALVASVDQTGNELSQRRVELHFQRLQLSESVLQEATDIKQRVFAAYSVDFDGNVLQAFLDENKPNAEGGRPELLRERLASVEFDDQVAKLVASGKESAGELVVKSRLFFEGLHLWMRGRYGRGTNQGGLMKSRYAIQSQEAQVALLMPTEPPTPIDPLAGQDYQTPEVDRRHHYIWLTEQPRLQTTTAYFH